MKKIFLLPIVLFIACITASAQQEDKNFHGYFFNKEYNVYLKINFHEHDVEVPGQARYGKLRGYLGKLNNSFCWPITSCKIKNHKLAVVQLINDYGSEDFKANVVRVNDSTYVLKHISGSPLKVPNNGKWQKLPKSIVFKVTKP